MEWKWTLEWEIHTSWLSTLLVVTAQWICTSQIFMQTTYVFQISQQLGSGYHDIHM